MSERTGSDAPGQGEQAASAVEAEKRSREATRRKLVATSAAVFARKGIDAASVNDLCAAAGFTRGAFYSNFASKTELALAVLEKSIEEIEEQLTLGLDTWLDPAHDPHEVVMRIVTGVSGRTDNTQLQAVRVDLFLSAYRSPEIREAVLPLRNRLQSALERALTRAAEVQDRQFRLPAHEVARIMLASYSGYLTDRMATGETALHADEAVAAMWFAFTQEQ